MGSIFWLGISILLRNDTAQGHLTGLVAEGSRMLEDSSVLQTG